MHVGAIERLAGQHAHLFEGRASLATGLGVLGLEEGYTLAESGDLAAYFIVREPGGELRGIPTSAFASLEDRPAPVAAEGP